MGIFGIFIEYDSMLKSFETILITKQIVKVRGVMVYQVTSCFVFCTLGKEEKPALALIFNLHLIM